MGRILLAGLLGPALVLIAAGAVGAALGLAWAIAVLIAGGAILFGHHLVQLGALARWAAGPHEAPVPEGVGVWRIALSALYRRVRTRSARQRDLSRMVERFRRAADAVPDGMVVLDQFNRIAWANARASQHLGLDLAQDEGKPLTHLVRQPEVLRYLELSDPNEPVILASQRISGLILAIQIVPFGTEERLLISRDVSQLEAVARMRRDFIANVSHELKTPLTVIVGYLETLQDLDLESEQRERFLKQMHEQAQSMERLVNDLLTLSVLESEHSLAGEATFTMSRLLKQVEAQAQALSDGRHSIMLEDAESAIVTGRYDELASALGNLASNAVRYTQPGGSITMAWRIGDSGEGLFSVSDDGIGIAPEHVPRLTERFYRVDRGRPRASGGTGLGLAIVKHVLVRHQGALDIKSEPGRGSRFTVRLPPSRVRRQEASSSGDGDR